MKYTHISYIIILMLIFSITTPIITYNVKSESDATIHICLPEGETQSRFNKQKMIAGIWHHVNISITNQDVVSLKIKLYKGSSIPSEKDITNYYEWTYTITEENKWIDNQKYNDVSYIEVDKCSQTGNNYNFYIGLKDTFPNDSPIDNIYNENWTMSIVLNDETTPIYNEEIVIEKPVMSFASSIVSDIYINVDPFTEMPAEADTRIRLKNNQGNLPFSVRFSYDDSEIMNILDLSNFNLKLNVDDEQDYYIKINSNSWSPGKIGPIEGTAFAEFSEDYIIRTTETVSFSNIESLTISRLTINVGHSGKKIVKVNDKITFQYEESITMQEGEIRDLIVYVTGDNDVTFDITSENIFVKILNIYEQDSEVNNPFTIKSIDTAEKSITVKVEAISEGKTGYINYNLNIDGSQYQYQTQISITAPTEGSETTQQVDNILTIIVVISVFLALIYMIYSSLKNRNRKR